MDGIAIRLCVLGTIAALGNGAGVTVCAEAELPVGSAPKPIAFDYFPTRMHAFVWRNWPCVEASRLAEVLGTTEAKVRAVAEAMGLPREQPISPLQAERGYISVIRRNWHLLNYEQLLQLLGWDAERLAYTLKEDDFLWVKLGRLKPKCEPLRYEEPDEATRAACAAIRRQVASWNVGRKETDPRFGFVARLSKTLDASALPAAHASGSEPIRFLYSYFAVYGDPLMNPELDPYPDGLLQRLAALGVNGVWLHTVLRQLAPSADFPEFGHGCETRLATLRRLVDRADRYGIKVYLYMNEPRSMPASFFDKHPGLAGTDEDGNRAMCTSVPASLKFVREGLTYVFREVPGLGGVFTITASENLTHCWSRGGQDRCPRCRNRNPAEVVAEVNAAIAAGVWAGNADAKVICWDWGWHDDWVPGIIARLPDGVYLMSVSEWSLPIERGGVATRVGEYSLSAVGPGPRATRHWQLARDRGLRTIAKVQVNCTWECAAMPYLPVMELVAEHMRNLAGAGVNGQMLSWSLGGYPSANLKLAQLLPDEAMRRVAVERYGRRSAPDVVRAWKSFSKAFREFPFDGRVLYQAPMQVGPANPLYLEPTGYPASMVGIPYDDLDGWRGPYPPDVFAAQFEKIAAGWQDGLAQMERAREQIDNATHRSHLEEDLGLARAAHCHFQSVANQTRFVMARNALASAADPAERKRLLKQMIALCNDEQELALELFGLALADSRIGYEASNHYFYYPLDLIEKAINCEHVRAHCTAKLKSMQ
jgi:hypothetical protein